MINRVPGPDGDDDFVLTALWPVGRVDGEPVRVGQACCGSALLIWSAWSRRTTRDIDSRKELSLRMVFAVLGSVSRQQSGSESGGGVCGLSVGALGVPGGS